jgi:predicted ferric reductase/Ca2+-binding EF-hand superfamily protein
MDARLVETLERAFAQHAGEAGAINIGALKAALGLRSDYLAQRMLAIFDENGDGVISREEFLASVRAIVFGTTHDKLWFAFRLHDHNGDGALERDELMRMIAISLAEDDVSVSDAHVEHLTDTLMSEADQNRDQRLSFDEFEAVVQRHPHLFEQMTRSEARWIAPNEDLLERFGGELPGRRERLRRYFENRRLPLAYISIWALVNVAIFAVTLLLPGHAHHGRPPPDLLQKFGGACTTAIELNAALLLFPVLRRLLTRVRRSRAGQSIPVDDAIDFHRIVGTSMFVFAIGHATARMVGYEESGKFAARMLSLEGLTGATLLVIFLVMWFFARTAVRRSHRFELFYFTHLLYVPFIVLAAVHAPSILAWGGVALAGFAIEQWLRIRQRAKPSAIISGEALRSGVTRLELARPAEFVQLAGDYLFLRVPDLARHEWHPFTISSAPESQRLTLHVRSLGNWTGALRRLIETRTANSDAAPLPVRIDGPYGAPTGHIFEARYAVMIGAGIGVTPFASVLESILHRGRQGEAPAAIEKAHFFWLNRDQYSFEWFAALLAELEQSDSAQLLDLHIHMTGGRGGLSAAGLEVARELSQGAGLPDVVTGLRAKTHMGQPDWRQELRAIKDEHDPERVHVFFCGPPGLGRRLRPICEELGMPFREERF